MTVAESHGIEDRRADRRAGARPQDASDVPTTPAAIRVRHLWHRFGARDVLRDVTFDVGRGEIFGFIGPNGAGKTTTLRVMATLLEPMAGRVEIQGLDVTMEPEKVRRIIGYMADHAGIYERISVREYLEFFADAYRIPALDVVDAVLELTDIKPLEDQIVATLSKGQKQRLQLARILLHDPEVLILDEPASDLDPRARIEIRDLLIDLQSLGKTIILSSHILSELSDVCTSVGILERGRMVIAGPIHEIADRLAAQQAAEAYGHPAAGPAGYPAGGPAGYPAGGPAGYPAQGGAPVAPGFAAGSGGGAPAGPGQPPGVEPAFGLPPGATPMAGPATAAGPLGPTAGALVRRGLKLRVMGDPRAAAFALQGGPGITDVQIIGAAVQIGYVGGDEKIAQIVRHLVLRNFALVAVEPERSELERIFLEATRTAEGRGP